MVSNGRRTNSKSRVPYAKLGNSHTRMPGQRADKQRILSATWYLGKSYYYWLRKLRDHVAEAVPQIVPLNLKEKNEDTLEICYRGAKLQLPGNIEIESVAAILRSIQTRC